MTGLVFLCETAAKTATVIPTALITAARIMLHILPVAATACRIYSENKNK